MTIWQRRRPLPAGADQETSPVEASAGHDAGVPASRLAERRRHRRHDARKGTRVLIIEDSATVVMPLMEHLVSKGYEVYQVDNAEDGIELAQDAHPELIFLDLILPGMDGFAALRHMRRDPATRATPVIMITGSDQITERIYASRIGADDIIRKPLTRPVIFTHIEPLLDEWHIPRRSVPVLDWRA